MRASLARFLADRQGSTTTEFVAVFLAFITVMFVVIEITLYMFSLASLEKAAEAGARAAVVSRPVVSGVPALYVLNDGAVPGRLCSHPSDPCAHFPIARCVGGAGCEADEFNRIVRHMRGFNGRIAAQNVTVTYQDVGIGFAGGPAVPMVTVTVSGVPFQTGIFGLLLQGSELGLVSTLPARSASMTGEDLAQ